MNSVKKEKNIYYFFIIIMYCLIFQNLIQQYFKVAKYFDELLGLLFVPVIFIVMAFNKQWKIKKEDFIIGLCLLGVIFIGIYSNIKYQYQPLSVALSDLILVIKFWGVYYLFKLLNKDKILFNYSSKIVRHIEIITIILFIITILNYIFKLYPSAIRFGIMTNTLFYSIPSQLATICAFLLTSRILFNGKINSIYTYMLIIIIFTTLRIKAIGFLTVFAIIAIYVSKKEKKITFSKIGILALICIAVAYQQIEYYFIEIEDSARASLLTTSFEIAGDYFPIGTGFATFASYFSGVNYSPIYYMYGINDVYGLIEGRANFISDSFWPMILGQFGYLGTLLYLTAIILIFKKIQKQYTNENKYEYIAKISALAYLIISSTSEAAFVNPLAIGLAIVLAI